MMTPVQKKISDSPDMFNTTGIVIRGEPLWRHGSMLIGGPADYFSIPDNENDLRTLLTTCGGRGMDYFILGGGSNLLVADEGIRGLVIDMRNFNDYYFDGNLLVLGAGLDVSTAAWRSGSEGYDGPEFLFGMPGTIGGAIWMNARCYGKEIADILEWIDVMAPNGRISRHPFMASQWSYKVSPFQVGSGVILRGGFRVSLGHAAALRKIMLAHHSNRVSRGHYRAPCAGSTFKNDRTFGAPSGAIIDRCGLKGFKIGRAAVSEWHANIVVNLGGAKAAEVSELIDTVAHTVEHQTGFRLKTEIIRVGDWPGNPL